MRTSSIEAVPWSRENIFTLWLWLTVCHGKIHHAIKFGKPSISINGPSIPWQTVSHNQSVNQRFNAKKPIWISMVKPWHQSCQSLPDPPVVSAPGACLSWTGARDMGCHVAVSEAWSQRSLHLLKPMVSRGCWKNEVEGILWHHEKIDEHEDKRILGWFYPKYSDTPVSRYKNLW